MHWRLTGWVGIEHFAIVSGLRGDPDEGVDESQANHLLEAEG